MAGWAIKMGKGTGSPQLAVHISPQSTDFFAENVTHEVLAIEDAFDILKLYRTFLGMDGIGINVCQNGAEAIEAIERLKPKVVLLDMHLPSVKGETIYEYLKDKHPGIVVLVVTADEALYKEYRERGKAFLKPMDFGSVRQEVKELFQR